MFHKNYILLIYIQNVHIYKLILLILSDENITEELLNKYLYIF